MYKSALRLTFTSPDFNSECKNRKLYQTSCQLIQYQKSRVFGSFVFRTKSKTDFEAPSIDAAAGIVEAGARP